MNFALGQMSAQGYGWEVGRWGNWELLNREAGQMLVGIEN
jgi:hypothetical protein